MVVPPSRPPRLIILTISINPTDVPDRATLAEANTVVGHLIRLIDDGILRNANNEKIGAFVSHFEVGE